MKIKYKKLHPDAKLPTKEPGAIGWDLYYCGEDIKLYEGSHVLLETGLAWQPEPEYHGLIWDRSGLAAKDQIHRLAGVIDNSYRGEIKIVLKALSKSVNKPPELMKCNSCGHSNFPVIYTDGIQFGKFKEIKKGDKIAQIIIQKEIPVENEWADELDDTERGENGFGSTGR